MCEGVKRVVLLCSAVVVNLQLGFHLVVKLNRVNIYPRLRSKTIVVMLLVRSRQFVISMVLLTGYGMFLYSQWPLVAEAGVTGKLEATLHGLFFGSGVILALLHIWHLCGIPLVFAYHHHYESWYHRAPIAYCKEGVIFELPQLKTVKWRRSSKKLQVYNAVMPGIPCTWRMKVVRAKQDRGDKLKVQQSTMFMNLVFNLVSL